MAWDYQTSCDAAIEQTPPIDIYSTLSPHPITMHERDLE